MDYKEKLKEYGYWIVGVPKEELTYELCKIAVDNCRKNFRSSRSILDFIPYDYITSDLAIEALKKNGDALLDIPYKLKKSGFITYEMYKIAVSELGDSLRGVPRDVKTKELCEMAIFNDGRALRFTPEEYITEELIIQAIKTVPQVINCLAAEKLTDAVLYEYTKRVTALSLHYHIPDKIEALLKERRIYS